MWKHILLFSICVSQVQGRVASVRGRGSASRQELLTSESDGAEPIAVPPKVWPHKDVAAPADVAEAVTAAPTTQAPAAGATQAAGPTTSTEWVKAHLENPQIKVTEEGEQAAGTRSDMRSVPHVIATWTVLLVILGVGHQVTKSWTSEKRAPYIAFGIILVFVLLSATVFFFLSTHDWRWLECIYFSIVTVTTVGYGDFVPEDTTLDKVLLIGFLWFNMAVLSIVMSIVLSNLPSGSSEGKGLGLQTGVLAGIVLGGTFIFQYLEGWTFVEALQFTTVTVTTVGYGHLLPSQTNTCLIFASCFILLGVPTVGAFVGKLGSAIDNHFSEHKDKIQNSKNGQTKMAAVYIGIIIAWLLFGATGFHIFNTHDWNWVQCFYLAAVTMTTVGYGDFVPSRAMIDHLLVIVYIWGSVIVIAVVFSDLNDIIIKAITAGMDRAKSLNVQLGILALCMTVGIIAMAFFEGWGILNGLVYTSVSLTTVGYGRLVPTTDPARLFAIPYLLFAVPMTGALVSNTQEKYSNDINAMIVGEESKSKS